MKRNLTKLKRIFLSVIILMMFAGNAFPQGPNDYNLCVRNVHQTSPSVLELDVWLEWTGTNTQKFQFFQGGLNFNYAGIANGGTITGAFVAGSADASLPVMQKTPNWNINQISKQIRMIAAIATPSSTAAVTPAPPGFRLGTFRMTNTVPFSCNNQLNFAWSFATGTGTTTQTKEGFYLNGLTTGTGFVDVFPFPHHCPMPNVILGVPCSTADAGGPYSSCGDIHLNGSITFASVGTWTSSGTGTFDPNNTTLNAIYHPSASDLVNGVTLTLTNDGGGCVGGGCGPAVSSVQVSFTSIDDNDLCTTDGCDQALGLPTHTAVNIDDNNACTTDACDPSTGVVTHTAVNIDDNNACTTDACDPATGAITHTAVNINDNDACTKDACDPATGAITHTAVDINDNDACTKDACDPATGVVTHTAVNIDDNNACTTDACDPATGVVTHTAVNIDDNNACTTDACDPSTGVVTHTAVNINDGNPCTIDACDPATGDITHTDDSPTVTALAGTIACYGGNTCVTVTASGGQLPYTGTDVFCGYADGTYNFDVTDAKGCTITSSVTITQPSKLTLTIISTPSSGSDGKATVTSSGGTPGYSFLWTPSGQTSAIATGLAPGNYCVIITDVNGCTATICVVVGSSCIIAPPGPISGVSGVCKKQSGVVYCVTPNPFATSYLWILPAGATAVGATNGPCITLKFTSKFKGGFICAKAITTCGTTGNACLNVVLITSKPNTPGIITGPATLCPNATATYSILAVTNATSYIWSFSGNLQILSGQGTTSIVVNALSNWNGGSVKVKAVNCFDHSGNRTRNVAKDVGCRLSPDASVTESVNVTEALSALTAYPNPTSGKVKVTFNSDRNAKYTLKVVDMIGNVLINESIPVVEGYNLKEINLKNIAEGIYMISVQTEDDDAKTLRMIHSGN